MSSSKKTSPWVYVGCGCAVIAVLAITAIAAVGMLGWREIREIEANLKDPVARDAKVREMLGADTLPAGLNGQLYLHLPFVLDLAMISDAEPQLLDQGDDPTVFRRNQLTYLDIRDFGGRRDRFRSRISEGRRATDALDDIDFDLGFRGDDVLEQGEAELGDWRYAYQLLTGEVEGRGPDRTGVATLGDIRCDEDDGRLRVLIWFRADEEQPGENGEPGADLGSPREAADLERLLGAFDPCGEG